MRTDGRRVVLLSAIGIPIAIAAARYLPDTSGPHHDIRFIDTRFVLAVVVAGGLASIVWLAVSSGQIGRATWLAIAVAGIAAFGLSLSAEHENLTAPALAGIFWWFAGALLVLPAGQALRAVQRARDAIRHAPYGQGASGIDSHR